MECREAQEHIPAHVDRPGGPVARALDSHLRSCERCQGELSRYRELHGALASLATRTIEPPAWLMPVTIERVRSRAALRARIPDPRHVRDRLTDPRIAAAGGAALVLAGLATAFAVRGRRRRRRLVTLRTAALA